MIHSSSHRRAMWLCGLLGLACATGCDQAVGLGLSQIGLTDGDNGQVHEVEWQETRATITGDSFPLFDYDTYSLGVIPAGQTIRITAAPDLLKPSMILVDAKTRSVRNGLDGGSHILFSFDYVPPADEELILFVGPGHTRLPAVAALPLPVQGRYTITVDQILTRQRLVQSPRQVIIVDFDGGVDDRYFDSPTNIQPFRAADYNSALADHDDAIKSVVMSLLHLIYANYDVDIRSSDEEPIVGAVAVSRIYVTAPNFFGDFAGGQVRFIDFGNRDPGDVGIVSVPPESTGDASRFGRRIGRLVGHEIGHLLGLLHQSDGLMSYNTAQIGLLGGPISGYFGFVEVDSLGLPFNTPEIIQDTPKLLNESLGTMPFVFQSNGVITTDPTSGSPIAPSGFVPTLDRVNEERIIRVDGIVYEQVFINGQKQRRPIAIDDDNLPPDHCSSCISTD